LTARLFLAFERTDIPEYFFADNTRMAFGFIMMYNYFTAIQAEIYPLFFTSLH
jgi:hypothetical protein